MFLREAERQQLQALLHTEVLRLIVSLQRRFRAHLERKQFIRMRDAAVCIQVNVTLFHTVLQWVFIHILVNSGKCKAEIVKHERCTVELSF